jgi:hypothetical protein
MSILNFTCVSISLLFALFFSYILHSTHKKVLPVLYEQCQVKDQEIYSKLVKICDIPPVVLGIRDEICCSLKTAVGHILVYALSGYTTYLSLGCRSQSTAKMCYTFAKNAVH